MNRRTSRKMLRHTQQIYFDSITEPIRGALSLLNVAEIEFAQTKDRKKGVNIASAFRTLDAMWSLYAHLGGKLTKKQRSEIVVLLNLLQNRLKLFTDDPLRRDLWDDAMQYYNEV